MTTSDQQDRHFRGIKTNVFLLLAIFIVTFLSGFLKYTPFEHVSVLLFVLLFVVGMILISKTSKTSIGRFPKIFLLLTGITTILFMVLVLIAFIMSITSALNLSDALEVLEGLFYLTTVPFLIGVLGSIILLNIKRGSNSSGS